jgi:thiamine-phosphate pyrophosphorylase
VHVGGDDLPVSIARRLLGDAHELGGTARDAMTARRCQADGATYLGVGPVYATRTKRGLPPPLGLVTLASIAEAVSIPVIAVAGVSAARVPEVLAAGAHGVAVSSAVSEAEDPRGATKELLAALEAAP